MRNEAQGFDHLARLIGGGVDLLWSFFPVFLVALVLVLVGKGHLIAERSDLILTAAVVFAEGSWRARHGWFITGATKQLVGLLGAVVSTVLLVFVLLVEVEQVDRLTSHVKSNLFVSVQHWMVGLSLLYGLWVRVAVKTQEDAHRRYDQEIRDELDAMRAAQGLPSWSRRLEDEVKRLEAGTSPT